MQMDLLGSSLLCVLSVTSLTSLDIYHDPSRQLLFMPILQRRKLRLCAVLHGPEPSS
jgi:hypothetical protein